MLRYLGRDPRSVSERLRGRTAQWTFRLADHALAVEAKLEARQATCRIYSPTPRLAAGAVDAARAMVRRSLGLGWDPRPFERHVAQQPRLAPLVADQSGLTVPQTRDGFDALMWVVVGQQVSLPVAFALRRRLTARFGLRLADDWFAPPAPERVAESSVSELRQLGFSQRKAEYALGIARAVVAGELDLGLKDRRPAEVEAQFLAVRGLGPWSVNYLMMRAFGFADCVPIGDAALARRLQGFFGLPSRPDAARTASLMAPFAPFRSLATFYFWSFPEVDG